MWQAVNSFEASFNRVGNEMVARSIRGINVVAVNQNARTRPITGVTPSPRRDAAVLRPYKCEMQVVGPQRAIGGGFHGIRTSAGDAMEMLSEHQALAVVDIPDA